MADRDFSAAATAADKLFDESLRRLHNLPVHLTSFIGREKETSDLVHLLHSNRLVTIHGSGRNGQNPLVPGVAAQVQEVLLGWRLVGGAGSADGCEKIPQLINATLGLIDSRSRSALDLLVDFLGEKQMLLILDNCEHLIAACARWLTGC